MENDERCGNCVYFNSEVEPPSDSAEFKGGICARYPRGVVKPKDGWCGEWASATEDEE